MSTAGDLLGELERSADWLRFEQPPWVLHA